MRPSTTSRSAADCDWRLTQAHVVMETAAPPSHASTSWELVGTLALPGSRPLTQAVAPFCSLDSKGLVAGLAVVAIALQAALGLLVAVLPGSPHGPVFIDQPQQIGAETLQQGGVLHPFTLTTAQRRRNCIGCAAALR